ncbi:MAG: hypothetical protein ACOYX1_02620 [Acidobacteriota bacterium]
MTQQLTEPKSQAVILAFHTDLDTINAALSTNIGSGGLTEFDLPRIKIPAGGGIRWAVPTLEGEVMEPSIEGVIVLARDTRAYYSQPISETGGSQPPDCWSADGATGSGKPGGACLACPLARYGSAPGGRGQACKQIKQLFVLRGSLLLPEVVTLPPTSLKPAKQYLLKLTSQGVPYYAVVTRIGLERTKNAQGIAYSRAVLSFVRRLAPEEVERAREYHEMLKPLVQRMAVDLEAAEVQDE